MKLHTKTPLNRGCVPLIFGLKSQGHNALIIENGLCCIIASFQSDWISSKFNGVLHWRWKMQKPYIKIKIDVCKTPMLLSPTFSKRLDLRLWPTNLNINRDHLLVKEYVYLPTKFEASGAKLSWVISNCCTRCCRQTWPWPLTYWHEFKKRIIYWSRSMIYLPSLKLLGQSVPDLSVAQGVRDGHDLWPWPPYQ